MPLFLWYYVTLININYAISRAQTKNSEYVDLFGTQKLLFFILSGSLVIIITKFEIYYGYGLHEIVILTKNCVHFRVLYS